MNIKINTRLESAELYDLFHGCFFYDWHGFIFLFGGDNRRWRLALVYDMAFRICSFLFLVYEGFYCVCEEWINHIGEGASFTIHCLEFA